MKVVNLAVFLTLGVSLIGCFNDADRDNSGQIVAEGSLDAFSIRVGDCTNDADDSVGDEIIDVVSVNAVPCSEPHDNEFYHIFDLKLPAYPGEQVIYEQSLDGCYDAFEAFVGLAYERSILEIYTIFPTVDSWAGGDREVVCGVFHMEYEKLVGSMRGMAI